MGATPENAGQGREAATPSEMPPPAWRAILLRTAKEASGDNVGLVAAGVAFYGFLALVPLLGATVLTYGLVADPATVARHFAALTDLLPHEVAQVVGEQLLNVVRTSEGKKGLALLAALGIALFGARNAAGAIVTALNIAYEEEEKRGFLKVTLLALAMTAAAVLALVVALLAVAMLGFLDDLLPTMPTVLVGLSRVLAYLVLGAAAAAMAATLYRYGPSREKARWRWLTPGSLLFALAFVVLTLGFGFYAANFGDYGATYGSLSAVVVLLTWLYLSSYALVFGAELNSEVEHQTRRDTTDRPERPFGERGAWSADHVAPTS